MPKFQSYTDFIRAANGHLSPSEAEEMFNLLTGTAPSVFTDPKSLAGASTNYARTRAAQRLYTNPALSDEMAAQLESKFDLSTAPATTDGKTVVEGNPVEYRKAREARSANYTAKHGK